MPVYYFIDKQLRENFKKSELCCPCCNKFVHQDLFLDALQELRDICGKPITVISGYRCDKWNKLVKGKDRSYHKYGRAADIRIECCDVRDMVEFALLCPSFEKGGIGIYSEGFIHVDSRGHKSGRWGRIDGKYVGWDEAFKKLCRR